MTSDDSKHITILVHETLSIHEVAEHTGVSLDQLEEYLALGLLTPKKTSECVEFSYQVITRVNKIARLQHELDLDLRSMDLILDLLERIDALESEVCYLKRRLRTT